jgi:hypothetical protein
MPCAISITELNPKDASNPAHLPFYNRFDNYLRKINLQEATRILIPICNNVHWYILYFGKSAGCGTTDYL